MTEPVTVELVTDVAANECFRRLRSRVATIDMVWSATDRPVWGSVDSGSFRIRKRRRLGTGPEIAGRLEPSTGGTRITTEMVQPPGMRVLWLVGGAFLCGLLIFFGIEFGPVYGPWAIVVGVAVVAVPYLAFVVQLRSRFTDPRETEFLLQFLEVTLSARRL
jgi:hypothetical protein